MPPIIVPVTEQDARELRAMRQLVRDLERRLRALEQRQPEQPVRMRGVGEAVALSTDCFGANVEKAFSTLEFGDAFVLSYAPATKVLTVNVSLMSSDGSINISPGTCGSIDLTSAAACNTVRTYKPSIVTSGSSVYLRRQAINFDYCAGTETVVSTTDELIFTTVSCP